MLRGLTHWFVTRCEIKKYLTALSTDYVKLLRGFFHYFWDIVRYLDLHVFSSSRSDMLLVQGGSHYVVVKFFACFWVLSCKKTWQTNKITKKGKRNMEPFPGPLPTPSVPWLLSWFDQHNCDIRQSCVQVITEGCQLSFSQTIVLKMDTLRWRKCYILVQLLEPKCWFTKVT